MTTTIDRCRSIRLGSSQRGFTMVEVLVVMLIVGILGLLVVPSFMGEKRARLTISAKSSAIAYAGAIEEYAADHGGRYPDYPAEWQDYVGSQLTVPNGFGPINEFGARVNGQPATYLDTPPEPVTKGLVEINSQGQDDTAGIVYTVLNGGDNYELEVFVQGEAHCKLGSTLGQGGTVEERAGCQ